MRKFLIYFIFWLVQLIWIIFELPRMMYTRGKVSRVQNYISRIMFKYTRKYRKL